ncbi:hypothetical protein [Kineosporia sp. NBRC 101731]|uniref:DUF7007 domain-containing protein n=1 Tax=Kineosporia sp. NBRC 101731 TaxID=3032199 RepID=UPI0024A08D25|nr:hypothetical protein [Kineosporia sp. NBRC 101731]GLY30892.1 hypothetical protein Kisp02_42570 [Kineosporia sp. NBRC 101731]
MLTTEPPPLSPWGSIRAFDQVGTEGILRVHTDTGTGYFVPRQLNARVHEIWRIPTGWYGHSDEDRHWAIVAITFPALFPDALVEQAHALQQQADSQCYTIVLAAELAVVTAPVISSTTEATTTNDSSEPLPERTQLIPIAASAPADQQVPETPRPAWVRKSGPIARQVWGDWHETVPTGFVGVVASPDEAPEDETWHLVPVQEYESRGTFRFVVDVENHEAWSGHP